MPTEQAMIQMREIAKLIDNTVRKQGMKSIRKGYSRDHYLHIIKALVVMRIEMTLDELKQSLAQLAQRKPGEKAICPVCERSAPRVYRRTLSHPQAYFILWLTLKWIEKCRAQGGSEIGAGDVWVDVREFGARGGDYAKVRHWGLAITRPPTKGRTRDQGMWQPTSLGVDFARGKCSVPRQVFLLNNAQIGVSMQKIYLAHALNENVDFRAMWERMSK